MILLTRLDKSKLLVNVDAIKYIESTPDTLLTFLNGDTLLVLEPLEDIQKAVIEYRVKTLEKLRLP